MPSKFALILLPAALLAGCATHAVDKNYGQAHERLLREQTYDVTTLGGHGDTPVMGMDPNSAELALGSMRLDVTSRKAVTSGPVTSGAQQSGGGSQ
ncbi:MAG: hypothetical protein WB781_24575 [Candidatus Sulfotelmatobacter sp.]